MIAHLLLAALLTAQPPSTADNHSTFWQGLQTLCGRAFSGRLALAPEGDETFAGKLLVIHARDCREDRMRIPFVVGEDRSRVWLLSRTPDGLRLKHDHRHEDGSEDRVSFYGGDTRDAGTPGRQDFYADPFTAELLPAAASNVWTLEIEPGQKLVYALERRGTDRKFRVEFDLTQPVEPPREPWGWTDTPLPRNP